MLTLFSVTEDGVEHTVNALATFSTSDALITSALPLLSNLAQAKPCEPTYLPMHERFCRCVAPMHSRLMHR
jgi:hypothetical protein